MSRPPIISFNHPNNSYIAPTPYNFASVNRSTIPQMPPNYNSEEIPRFQGQIIKSNVEPNYLLKEDPSVRILAFSNSTQPSVRKLAPEFDSPFTKESCCSNCCWVIWALIGLVGLTLGLLFGLGILGQLNTQTTPYSNAIATPYSNLNAAESTKNENTISAAATSSITSNKPSASVTKNTSVTSSESQVVKTPLKSSAHSNPPTETVTSQSISSTSSSSSVQGINSESKTTPSISKQDQSILNPVIISSTSQTQANPIERKPQPVTSVTQLNQSTPQLQPIAIETVEPQQNVVSSSPTKTTAKTTTRIALNSRVNNVVPVENVIRVSPIQGKVATVNNEPQQQLPANFQTVVIQPKLASTSVSKVKPTVETVTEKSKQKQSASIQSEIRGKNSLDQSSTLQSLSPQVLVSAHPTSVSVGEQVKPQVSFTPVQSSSPQVLVSAHPTSVSVGEQVKPQVSFTAVQRSSDELSDIPTLTIQPALSSAQPLASQKIGRQFSREGSQLSFSPIPADEKTQLHDDRHQTAPLHE